MSGRVRQSARHSASACRHAVGRLAWRAGQNRIPDLHSEATRGPAWGSSICDGGRAGRRASAGLGIWLAVVGILVGAGQVALPERAGAQGWAEDRPAARQKPGPATIRGIAQHVSAGGFVLVTPSHGSYQVIVVGATQIVEKSKHGKLTVHEGEHVGVRGFVHGRKIQAIRVTIYPVKPKPYSLKGTVTAVRGSQLALNAGGRTTTVSVTGQTSIRVGTKLGSLRDINTGDQVDVRVQPGDHGPVALHIHVYKKTAPKEHIELRGTITRVTSSGITVRAGSGSYQVRIVTGTRVYLGNELASQRALKQGETASVHACCQGGPLTATSIHIARTVVKRQSVQLHGSVTSLTSTRIAIRTSSGEVTAQLGAGTQYEVGSSRVPRTGVYVGDDVSIRAWKSGSQLEVERVHVYASSRRPRRVVGVVVAVTKAGLVVEERGKRYLITADRGVSIELGGKRVLPGALRKGDHLDAVGQLRGTTLTATQIAASRAAPKLRTVHGTVTQIHGAVLVITDDSGTRFTVRLARGARVRLQGKPAPSLALFPGVRASAHGIMSGTNLTATVVTLTVKSRTERGRVSAVGSGSFQLQLSSGTSLKVDLPAQASVRDGTRRGGPGLIVRGGYVRVQGYLEPSGAVRATAVNVLHPSLEISGTVVSVTGGLTLQTSKGDRYRLYLSSSTHISTDRENISLGPRDIPVGARLHVVGTVQSDGSLNVSQVKVRLRSATVHGQVKSVSTTALSLDSAGKKLTVRLTDLTVLMQGSHSLSLSDLVPGDDVTVYGYDGGADVVLARRVLVHRRLVGMDGKVASVTPNGFVLTASDGSHAVIVTDVTVMTGGTSADISPGVAVHVTGYLRGDGSLLATRVRVGKKPLA